MIVSWALLWAAASFLKHAQAQTVFAHFMVGNTGSYELTDIQEDIRLAQEAHIDGFALNFEKDSVAAAHSMDMIFQAAEAVGFKLIFSFDYAASGTWPKEDVASYLEQYTGRIAYFRHHGEKPLVSTFEGPNQAEDWIDLKAKFNVFFMPSYSSLGAKKAMQKGVADGLFSWAGWPKGPTFMTTEVDASYKDFLGGKPYMMPVSPWFYTNMPGYDKNWLWSSNDLWYDRWNEVWFEKPEYVQIISWNDYGESHHIGPIREKAMVAFGTGKAPYNYALNKPHDAWRQFLPFVIDMYKGGAPTVNKEGLTIWYRTNPHGACLTGGTTGNTASQLQTEGDPSEFLEDSIMFTALLTTGDDMTVRVKIGNGEWTNGLIDFGNTRENGNKVGLYHGSVPIGNGKGAVTVEVIRGGNSIVSVTGPSIDTFCINNINNYNPWVGGAWSSRTASGTALPLSQQGCISGTGTAEEFNKLCRLSCLYDYCPPGPCTCAFMGIPNQIPPAKEAEGYPNPGAVCSFLGLCSFGCSQGHCYPEYCNRDPANKGVCYVPPDLPDPEPTPTEPAEPTETVILPSVETDTVRLANSANCAITMPMTDYWWGACYNFCKATIEDAEKEGRTTSYGCLSFTPLDQELEWDPWNLGSYPGIDGNTNYTIGKCWCDNPFANLMGDLVLESIPAIAQIGCYITMSTFREFFEFGLDLLPGAGKALHAGYKAIIWAVKFFKFVYKGSQAIDGFDFWLSPCGGDDLVPDDIKKVFEVADLVADGVAGWLKPKNIGEGSGKKGDSANPIRDRTKPTNRVETRDMCLNGKSNSGKSTGPNYYNKDLGFYCDRKAKKVYGICGGNVVKNCYDIAADSLKNVS